MLGFVSLWRSEGHECQSHSRAEGEGTADDNEKHDTYKSINDAAGAIPNTLFCSFVASRVGELSSCNNDIYDLRYNLNIRPIRRSGTAFVIPSVLAFRAVALCEGREETLTYTIAKTATRCLDFARNKRTRPCRLKRCLLYPARWAKLATNFTIDPA